MTLQDAEIHELEMLAKHEEAIGDLYDAYATAFPDQGDFWSTLANEERGHAAWIRMMYSKVEDGVIEIGEGRFNAKAIETSLGYVKRWITDAQHSAVDLQTALSIALDIENALIERSFYKVYDTDNETLRQVFNALVEGCRQHRARIVESLDKVKRGDFPPPEVPIG
jgi:rubrerythrin